MSDDAPSIAGWNLALRFALEVAAVVGLVVGGHELIDGTGGGILGVGAAIVAIVAWATFNVPGDPSRSGAAPIAVPGVIRLCVEIDVLVAGGVGLFLSSPAVGVIFVVLVVVHYVASFPRVRWLASRSFGAK